MPRPRLPLGDARPRAGVRAAGMVAGFVLGVIALWLIVASNTQKQVEVGVIVGIWGALIAAFSARDARRSEAVRQAQEFGGELAVRAPGDLDRRSDAAALRAYEQRLQSMVRHQIEESLGPELAALRGEITALRSDLVEKVGGQLRLERIETTRLIGSDIEALQQEIQRLKLTRAEPDVPGSADVVQAVTTRIPELRPAPPAAPAVPPVPPAATSAPPAATFTPPAAPTAPPVPPAATFAPPVAPPAPAPAAPPPPAPPASSPVLPAPASDRSAGQPAEPLLAAPPAPEPPREPEPRRPEPQRPASVETDAGEPAPSSARRAPAAGPLVGADPFAGLPRIRPFTDFDLDPIEPVPSYSGRRRLEQDRPAAHAEQDAGGPTAQGGGRRRRDSHGGDDDDVLRRILQREQSTG